MPPPAIPNLDQVVLDALDLHASYTLPQLPLHQAQHRLVIASGNALPTARILFSDQPTVFADEGRYASVLDRMRTIDAAVVLSASGEKHAPLILADLLARGLSPYLITCASGSTAARLLPPEKVIATRSVDEPLTYNTSTYMGMMLLKTREDTSRIKRFLLSTIAPLVPDFRRYKAVYLMVSPEFELIIPMFVTKFDELFGGRFTGRCYTTEQTLHAKTVVPWDKELFISIGVPNEDFGSARLEVPLPDKAGYVAMMATGYFLIGRLQSQKPPWFKKHVGEYTVIQQKLFAKRKSMNQAPSVSP